MASNFWTFGDIKTKVRNITGLKSVNQLSETDLEEAINRYYFYKFVLETHPPELEDYWEFSTTAGDDSESFDDDSYVWISGDGWIDGYPFDIYYEPSEWFSRWPETSTYSQSRPTEALFYARELKFNPPPDDVYSVKIPVFARPTSFANDSDIPVREEWGPLISYGTAFEIVMENGNTERAGEIIQKKKLELDNIRFKQEQVLNTQRAMPRW